MKKRILPVLMLVIAALLFAGCTPLTVAEMYALPKRSQEHSNLQSAIDMAMAGLSYSAPVSGDNQQTVQMADLDGDGVDEYLVFAKGNTDKPMQILIFSQIGEDKIQIMSVIESNGSAFDRVEYVEVDHTPGCEIVVGRQVSDQLMGSLGVYSFRDGYANQIMNARYSRFLTHDIDQDDKAELLVFQQGESESGRGIAVMYNFRGGTMERSVEMPLSRQVQDIRRMTPTRLQDGVPAVFVSSAADNNTIVTDVLCVKRGKLINLTEICPEINSVQTLRNYYVFAEDVDYDGALELPQLISVKPTSQDYNIERQYLINWYSLTSAGAVAAKMATFHNYAGGWFMKLDETLAPRVTVEQIGNTYIFHLWNEDFTEFEPLFTVYSMTGSDRKTQANADNRFPLHVLDDVVYAARLEPACAEHGITRSAMIDSFMLIHQDWRTGAT